MLAPFSYRHALRQNNSAVSILEQAKLASLLSRVCDTDPARWLDLRAAFGMGTEGGAKLLGLGGEAGVIEPGARADIALIDVTGPAWQPRSLLTRPSRGSIKYRILELLGSFGLQHRWMYDNDTMRTRIEQLGFAILSANDTPSRDYRLGDGSVHIVARKSAIA